MTTKVRSTLEATARLFGGAASIATEAKEALTELATLEDATWNAAIEAAAEFARESARRVRAETEKLGQAHSVIGETCAKTLESFDTNMRSALKRGRP